MQIRTGNVVELRLHPINPLGYVIDRYPVGPLDTILLPKQLLDVASVQVGSVNSRSLDRPIRPEQVTASGMQRYTPRFLQFIQNSPSHTSHVVDVHSDQLNFGQNAIDEIQSVRYPIQGESLHRGHLLGNENFLNATVPEALPLNGVGVDVRPIDAVVFHVEIDSDYVLQILDGQIRQLFRFEVKPTYPVALGYQEKLLDFIEGTGDDVRQVVFLETSHAHVAADSPVALGAIVKLT